AGTDSRATVAPWRARRGAPGWPRASTDPLPARKEAGRPEEQDHDDEQEAHRVSISGGNVAGAQLLDEGKDEPAAGGARNAAQPAEDHDGERLRCREITHRRVSDED